MSAVSSFKCQQEPPKEPSATTSWVDQAKQATCPDCKTLFKIFMEETWGWNTKPHTVCLNCYRVRSRRKCPQHMSRLPRPPVRPSNQTQYPKSHHLIPAMPAGNVAANMLQSDMTSSENVHHWPLTITSSPRTSGHRCTLETTPESQSLSPLTRQPRPDIVRPTAPRSLTPRSQSSLFFFLYFINFYWFKVTYNFS